MTWFKRVLRGISAECNTGRHYECGGCSCNCHRRW